MTDYYSSDGIGPSRPVNKSEIRIMIHDTILPYAIPDEELNLAIKQAIIVARSEYNVYIDTTTGYPATDLDEYIIMLLAVVKILENYTIRIKNMSSNGQCSSAGYLNFIDSISEGGSSLNLLSFGDLQTMIESKKTELENLKISRWGCALHVTAGNY